MRTKICDAGAGRRVRVQRVEHHTAEGSAVSEGADRQRGQRDGGVRRHQSATASSTSSPANTGTKRPSGRRTNSATSLTSPATSMIFADLPLDVNGDGKVDIISAHGFENKLVWMENPGKAAAAVEGTPHRQGLLHRVRVPGGSHKQRQGGLHPAAVWRRQRAHGVVRAQRRRLREARRQPACLRPRHRRGRRQRRWPHRHHHARGLVRSAARPAHRRVEVAPRLPARRDGLHPRAGHQRRRSARHRHDHGPRLRHFLDGADRGRQVDQAHDRRHRFAGACDWCWRT